MDMSLIKQDDCVAAVIDYQVKLLPQIHDHKKLCSETAMTIRGLKALNVPILVTQQYTKGMGETEQEIAEALEDYKPIEKKCFSCMGSEEFRNELEATGRHTVIILGIEAHICVLQTALELTENGYRVVLVTDCIGSREPVNKDMAVRRLTQAGCIPSTSEAVLYELMRTSENDAFKTILKLVK